MIDITKGIEPILVISGNKFTILSIDFYIINEKYQTICSDLRSQTL